MYVNYTYFQELRIEFYIVFDKISSDTFSVAYITEFLDKVLI